MWGGGGHGDYQIVFCSVLIFLHVYHMCYKPCITLNAPFLDIYKFERYLLISFWIFSHLTLQIKIVLLNINGKINGQLHILFFSSVIELYRVI